MAKTDDIFAAENHLSEFIRQAWHVTEPFTDYLHNWHIDAISEHLEAVTAGQITRLLINIPPRYMKSIGATIMWPCWEWIRRPHLRYLFASYSGELSTDHSVARRSIIESQWYQENWGHIVQISRDQNEKTFFRNTASGTMNSTSMLGTATGKGGNRVIIDDAHNPKQAESDLERESAVLQFRRTFSNRLNDKRHDAIVVIMQRLHQADLAGYCIERGYTHLCLPGEYEPDHPYVWARDPRTEVGQLLWPEREGLAEIEDMKLSLGSYGFAGQYQQRPAPAGGAVFKSEFFRYFEDNEEYYTLHRPEGDKRVVVSDCIIFQTVDLAASMKVSADYFVISTWAVTPNTDLLLLDVVRTHVEGPDQRALIQAGYERWKPSSIDIEKVGYQMTLIQEIMRLGLPARELIADRDKLSRALVAAVRYEAGRIYHRSGAHWLNAYEDELMQFPNGSHDDQVDTVGYAAIKVSTWGGMPTIATGTRKREATTF